MRLDKKWLHTAVFLSVLFGICSCYHTRPDEIQPEEVTRWRDQRFPRHPGFTQQNALLVKTGMMPSDIEMLFGMPDKVFLKTYWDEGRWAWRGLVYRYNMGRHPAGPYRQNVNTFVFIVEKSPPELVHWKLELVYPDISHVPSKPTGVEEG